ncbi:unnamed protein product, partial [Owenia fusiformis]
RISQMYNAQQRRNFPGSSSASYRHGRYTLYYSRLYSNYRSVDYQNKGYGSSNAELCFNKDLGGNRTNVGAFTCPLPFEPSYFVYCCGQQNSQYCCGFWDL